MRAVLLFLLCAGTALCQQTVAAAPKIALIEVYGNRKVDAKDIKKALGLKEGDTLPPSKGDLQDRLDAVKNVVASSVTVVCCDNGGVILYVGVEERGTTHFELNASPEREVRLPAEVFDAYTMFLELAQEAAAKGQSGDNLSMGHSLLDYGPARKQQLWFVNLAEEYFAQIRDVMLNSDDEDHRAAATAVLAYTKEKAQVVRDFQVAMKDPSPQVRNNAMRALAGFAVLADKDSEAGIKISPTWFIEMLNSLEWTDRNKASMALITLLEKRPQAAMEQLRDRALDSVVEMARWKDLGHSFAPFVLLGRAANIPEAEIQKAWTAPDHEVFIAKAYRDAKKLREEESRRNRPGRTTP
jgi:hypothetical protein